mmetsp:Transcript_65421/g.147598  ORF Transcript_65421/g.147598 Transcript_65421/m.147598 type:complete len:369 (+) Transcript_65421:91-1197(+)
MRWAPFAMLLAGVATGLSPHGPGQTSMRPPRPPRRHASAAATGGVNGPAVELSSSAAAVADALATAPGEVPGAGDPGPHDNPGPRTLISMVCSDVDGTLLRRDHSLSARTARAVTEVLDRGMPFAACTGRGRAGAYAALGEVGDRLRAAEAPGVFLNGGLVYAPGGALIRELLVPEEVTACVAAFSRARGCTLVAFSGDALLCEEENQWTDLFKLFKDPPAEAQARPWSEIAQGRPLHKLILLAEAAHLDALRPDLAQLVNGRAEVTKAVPEMLEVLPLGGSKGAGVDALLKHMGVDPAQVLALGDAENDVGMLELAGTSVAMGNACALATKAATHPWPKSNDQDGAASAIEALLLNSPAPSSVQACG